MLSLPVYICIIMSLSIYLPRYKYINDTNIILINKGSKETLKHFVNRNYYTSR